MGDDNWVTGVNLLEIKDELTLHEMLDRLEDYEDRKKVRSRLKDVIAQSRAKREEMIAHREADREEVLRARVRDADENKRRTLAMYDAMAKSAPAGGNKVMDINILREEMEPSKENVSNLANSNGQRAHLVADMMTGTHVERQEWSMMDVCDVDRNDFDGRKSSPSTPGAPEQAPRLDLVEQAIRQRQSDADDRKKRTLMAYDNAAKAGPAGAARFIDFEAVIKKEDLQNYDPNQKNNKSSTFQMFGGVPISTKQGPMASCKPAGEQPRDFMEESIRKRQAESDARKARTLAAYDKAAKSRPAGVPVTVYIPQEGDMEPVVDVANKRISPRERFQRMDSLTAPPAAAKLPTSTIPAKPAAAGLVRSPTAIKEMLLNWAKSKTKEYENVSIENFSTSWNDGMAFCALIHHFYPDAFDFQTLTPKNRRFNFDLAFRVAEEKGDVAPLLDVEDMVVMKKPDWKCVFTYVQSLYRRFHNVD